MEKQTLMSLFVEYILPPLVVGGAAIISKGLWHLAQWLKSLAATSKIAAVGAAFTEMAISVQAKIEVELVPAVKAAAADGKITAEEGAKLKTLALELLKKNAPPALLKQAASLFGGNLDTWLGGLIERANTESHVDAPKLAAAK